MYRLLIILIKLIFLKLKNFLKPSLNFKRQSKFKIIQENNIINCIHCNKKPNWVNQEIIIIKAHLPNKGCRYIAKLFNQKFKHQQSVSKTFVAYTIKNNLYQIMLKKRKIKTKKPYPISFNKVWGLDLTFINQKPILGMVEHHSRLNLVLKKIKNKSSITLLNTLLEVLQHYPKPEFIRTDNEICFNSKLFKLGLWLLDIKKQTTPNHSPWCNGRIERFFGTLKSTLKTLPNTKYLSKEQLPIALHEFSFWYNNIRLHQNLDYKTPQEIYQNGLKKYQQNE